MDANHTGHWVTARSSRGHEYAYFRRAMPWIEPQYLDCAVYLYPSEAAAQDGDRIGGSGFLLGLPLSEVSQVFLCVVTNKHAADFSRAGAGLLT